MPTTDDKAEMTGKTAPAAKESAVAKAPATQLEQPEGEASEREKAVEASVTEWFSGFRNGPLARDTVLWNIVSGRLPELISSIAKL